MLILLKDAQDISEYSKYLDDRFMRPIFEESKLTMGNTKFSIPQFAVSVDEIAKRVDIQLDYQNPMSFKPEQEVSLKVWVKNVQNLTIRVFELNTTTFYKDKKQEIQSNIDLDGLVAGYEEHHTFSNPPIERVKREFKFPKLPKRGVFAIEFIGGGEIISSSYPKRTMVDH